MRISDWSSDGCSSDLFVGDGHHRLKAYRRAQRETIPARVYPMDRRMAVLVSKLVNCDERALEMHAEQRRDAAWQYLAAVTRQGKAGMPEGDSCRTVAGRFGISAPTVPRMVRKLPPTAPQNFNPETHDPAPASTEERRVGEEGART